MDYIIIITLYICEVKYIEILWSIYIYIYKINDNNNKRKFLGKRTKYLVDPWNFYILTFKYKS